METYVHIPLWKAYLYTLIQRIRLYKRLNTNRVNLNLNRKEVVLLSKIIRKNLSKEVMRKPKAFKYDAMLQSVLVDNIASSTEEEVKLAFKLLWINQLNVKELIMEIKKIKEFGKMVGLKPLVMAKMDEDTLIVEILKNIDPQKEYDQEFVAWYESLNDKYFDMADGGSAGEAEAAGDDFAELIEAIQETEKLDELKEIAGDDDFKHLFESLQLGRYKSVKSLQKAMVDCLTTAPAEAGGEAEEDELDAETKEAMVEAIQSIENEDELIEFISDEDVEAYFQDKLEIGDEIDVDGLKAQMLSILGVEEKEEKKPMTLKERMAAKKAEKEAAAGGGESTEAMEVEFDPNAFDADEVYAAAEALGLPKLRKFAKQIGVTAPAGSKKDDILELVANQLVEMAEGGGEAAGEETGEVAINKALVQNTIDADDKDTLIAMCEEMGIKLNAIQKKSSKLMGQKLLEVVPDAPQDDSKAATGKRTLKTGKSEPANEAQSVYQTIEQMVLNKDSEADIVKAVTPWYKEKGQTLIRIKQRVKAMIEIVQGDYGMK